MQRSSGAAEVIRTAPAGTSLQRIYQETVEGNEGAYFRDTEQALEMLREDPTRLALGTEARFFPKKKFENNVIFQLSPTKTFYQITSSFWYLQHILEGTPIYLRIFR